MKILTAVVGTRMGSTVGCNPSNDRRPMLLQGARSHKETDVTARHGLRHELRRRCSKIFSGIENLLGRGDVIVCAGQQIGRAHDIAEIELSSQPDELALGKPVLL